MLCREYLVVIQSYSNFFPTHIFEKSVQLVGCVWPCKKGHTIVAYWTGPLAIPVSVTRNWKKMVNNWDDFGPHDGHEAWPSPPVWQRGSLRKRLEEQSRATQGKEGEHAYNISRKWKVHNCNFQLFLFDTPFWRNGLAGHQIWFSNADQSLFAQDQIFLQVYAFKAEVRTDTNFAAALLPLL